MSFLGTFLDQQRAKLNEIITNCIKSNTNKDNEYIYSCKLTFVLCNEASDLDSLICSLLWAHFKQHQFDETLEHKSDKTDLDAYAYEKEVFIPLFGMKKDELRLRKDCVHLFNAIDALIISENKLFFLDNIPFNTLITISHLNSLINVLNDEKRVKRPFCLEIHMVDHNELSIYLHAYLQYYVTLIIDHHKDKCLYLETVKTQNRYLSTVGVNVVFIIEIIDKLNKYKYEINREFAILINGAILLDLGAFDENLKKTTNRDMKIYKRFEKYNLNKDYKLWYKQLNDLRCDQYGFSFNDLLKMDLKIFKTNEILFSISCLYKQIKNKQSVELIQQIEMFGNEKRLHFVVVLLTYDQIREFGVFLNKNKRLFNHISTSLDKLNDIKMTLNNSMQTESGKIWYFNWYELDYSVSRKILDPIIRDIIKHFKA